MDSTDSYVTEAEVNEYMKSRFKTYENKTRRMAKRRGYNLQKSYMKDKLGIDYGTYRLSDLKTGTIIYAKETGYGYTIKEIENYLNKDNKND